VRVRVRPVLRWRMVPMIAVTLTITALCMVGAVMLLLALTPLVYAYYYALHEQEKQDISDALKIARTNKINNDRLVSDSRQHKLDSEVAILELRIEEKRRNLGLDQDFHPVNYE